MPVRERFQLCDILIIGCIAVRLVSDLSDLLKRVHDDKPGVGVSLHEAFHLFSKTAGQCPGLCGQDQVRRGLHSKHLDKPPLQSGVIVLQGEIEDSSLPDRIVP